jgi:hypothetical protein
MIRALMFMFSTVIVSIIIVWVLPEVKRQDMRKFGIKAAVTVVLAALLFLAFAYFLQLDNGNAGALK